ncbi:Glycosyl transferase, group 1 family protein [Sulfitobacter noctilucicola]|uniref:Glycosyltransferase involved in cell wall biosynthesis n=1 Tax=Sulfitobacter noctilucicola TaxID=1342301 RepID=A0A7W6Q608_9RHOB|nr:glycosyltransferase family 4 protein [Sulfitobacter noctilucicola]KIN64473.1 Glycosyl transferase, group 1 family protein [Sulfitobacter noctilucicola]MBB4174367.1 glycosyltransferase involved in cell wall biosynthesis [Sulfitobacter noctilucicola]
MKIAYILNTYPQPSQSFIRREIRSLERQGHDVLRMAMRRAEVPLVDAQDRAEGDKTEYVLSERKSVLAGALLQALKADPGQLHKAARAAIAMGRASENGVPRHLIYLAEAAFVAMRCRAEGVTHAHAHFGTNAAAVAMLSEMLGGPKFSFTVHGPEEFDAPRALSLGTKVAQSNFTVAISQFGRSQLYRWAAPADWGRIKVVHCGIEPAKFDAPAPMPQGPRRLVAIGRLVEQKGQLALIRALAQTRENIHVTLIGDGELRGEIETLMRTLGVADRVTLTGWVDEARIKDELSRAHALVMPSFAEGLPMVVMEAMAAARPVIATYIAGTPELVQDGTHGWLVPAGDVEALAGAMDACASTPLKKLSQMGDVARARVLERHDTDVEAAKLVRYMQGG